MTDHPNLEAARLIVARAACEAEICEADDMYCECRRIAREILALTQWREIDDEAPKDGTPFLIASIAGTGPTIGAFQDGYFRLVCSRAKIAGFHQWFWMPLPPPPADGETR